MREAIERMQIAGGWLFPNASMQFALPKLETLAFDIPLFQRKRDVMVSALPRSATGSLSPRARSTCSPNRRSPTTSSSRERSTRRASSCCPGGCSTPGFFRISLTATMGTIEAGLPRFAAAFRAVAAAVDA